MIVKRNKPTAPTPASTHRPLAQHTKPTGRHFNARLSMDDARAIRVAHTNRQATMDDLATKYGISKPCVWAIIHGKTYKEVERVSQTRVC